MRILYLTEESIDVAGTMVRGGAIHVGKVVHALRERGHHVTLLDWNSAIDGASRASITPRTRFVDGPVRTYRKAVGLARETNADVVVSKTRKTYLPGLAAARRVGVPHVVHVGSTLDAPHGASVPGRIDSRSFELRLRAPHDGYLVVCDYIREQLRDRGIPADRLHDVRNAVDVSVFDPDAPGTLPSDVANLVETDVPIVGYVGGLHGYKGVHDLLDAAREMDEDAHVVFAGDGPEKQALEERLANGTGDVLGAIPYESVPALYSSMDVLALPSHTEGLPRVVLEAQAMRTPVVATAVGGVPEVVDDGETGLLCPPQDPGTLAAALDRVLTDEALASTLAGQARNQVVEEFTWESLYDAYESALETVTASRRVAQVEG